MHVEHDDLVNRLTARWYLDSIEKQCAMFKGFLLFVEGRYPEASTQFDRMVELDEAIREAKDKGLTQTVYRLKVAMEKKGYLEGHPKELAMFPPRLRLIVKLGDFYHFTMQYDRAHVLFSRLEAGTHYGKLNRRQMDYVHYALGNSVHFMDWKPGGNSRKKVFQRMAKIL